MYKHSCALFVAMMLLSISTAHAEREGYTDRATFLAELQAMGYDTVQEGFESDAVWGHVRTTVVGGTMTAPAVSNRGITWAANNANSEITTSEGAALTGQWGVYSYPHGNFLAGTDCHLPVTCGDGFVGTGDSPVVAVGGWVDTNTPFAKLGMFIDGDFADPVDFGETCQPGGEDCTDNAIIGTTPEFFGFIDPAGFDTFEFRELEGTAEDQKLIFADAFTIAFALMVDSDGDGVTDATDNCQLEANPDQRDTNGDGFGNACDADLNDDCVTNFTDLGSMKAVFFTQNPDADLDGDGSVNFSDLVIMKSSFFAPPGPSGVENICSGN